ncbi:MAG: metal ABC transporter permease, partial [Candidatus Accumulibacter sp.]|nr:metal ABC transporter permease [Accumulibacter sp.]MCM8637474.1 metal ABC transporter permease [Accumulibacter sp.]
MRRTASDYPAGDRPAAGAAPVAATLGRLLPYLWQHKWRFLLALSCLVGAKIANVSVPLIFKEMIDGLTGPQQALILPAALLLLYGALRFSASLFAELREILFARV